MLVAVDHRLADVEQAGEIFLGIAARQP
jgi:hypothetical protein